MLLIFSLYLLVLPCLAGVETRACNDEMRSSVAQPADHDGHESKNDDCTSSCDCSCCVHIVSLNYQAPCLAIVKPVGTTKAGSFYNNISLPSRYFGNIWQPPKAAWSAE